MTETPRTPTAIDAIAERWVDTELDLLPEYRVYVGRPGREGEYGDVSPAGHETANEAAKAALAELRAAEPADDVDVVTKLDLTRSLELAVEQHESGWWKRDLNNIASPLQDTRDIFDLHPRASEHDWEVIATRLRNVPARLAGYVESLRLGVAEGVVPAIRQVRAGIEQADRIAAADGFFRQLAAAPDAPESLRSDLAAAAEQASAAYAELSAFLGGELAPVAGADDAVGRDFYQLFSRSFVGAKLDLDETYEWGVEELARMVEEQQRIANEILPGASVEEAVAHLDADPARKLIGTDALQRWMQAKSDQAVEELGRSHFEIPEPVRSLQCMIAPTQEGGIYYTPPTEDFSRPGQMWWSVPEGVTEFATWRELTTVYHEGVPGHHLQNGIAIYHRDQLNTWRRNNFTSGHGEGWALYAERLMEQLGYLDDPADRLGMLDGQRMRAARVVLDIGVHLGKQRPDGGGAWTGDYAYEFLGRNVNMNEGFVRFEVTRYLGWPGQAPSYKVGQRVWEQIRDELARREGAAFDIKAFHKKALELGGIGLDTLRTALLG